MALILGEFLDCTWEIAYYSLLVDFIVNPLSPAEPKSFRLFVGAWGPILVQFPQPLRWKSSESNH